MVFQPASRPTNSQGGEMMPEQAVAWLKRRLAPQSALTEQRLTDFYLHSTAVEKSELERI